MCKMPADEPYSGISVAISHAKVVLLQLRCLRLVAILHAIGGHKGCYKCLVDLIIICLLADNLPVIGLSAYDLM